jgi:RimJ/RimL family protein N-acetyltransferase
MPTFAAAIPRAWLKRRSHPSNVEVLNGFDGALRAGDGFLRRDSRVMRPLTTAGGNPMEWTTSSQDRTAVGPAAVTQRLRLDWLGPQHAAAVHAAIRASHRELAAWLPWARSLPSLADTAAFCAEAEALRAEVIDYRLAISLQPAAELVGIISWRVGWQREAVLNEVGYWIRSDCRARGLMTEALRCVLTTWLAPRRGRIVFLTTDARNLPSRRVALHGGLSFCRTFRAEQDETSRQKCLYAQPTESFDAVQEICLRAALARPRPRPRPRR